ncbi:MULTISPECIES: hypothetical protein [unclassified Mesorhizobium]|uniref:hypothetical protein n=1 Tax=unclassified Mesorhizobium TaxID=325217 RepID=UPI000BD5F444|nr:MULTISPECIES: hypothetical protein [unclassified Mesorhizobium]TGT61149.1 hypothetical protein EN813_019600 [Mesorhizobium sp. M00.F.Ca.ET.170.01.1.1]AZO08917.1 hypothetical protein EJ074_07220 [Mesorhizobium sp. M3A.F.Ca.ET.080.04.2.1]PBB84218.1 hypothetical protein CK216_24330 [Mesorhizobium sp. WSM3876]RWB68144.1 MAG: hypothetical protein EOQ49_23440 [Mesorhizobium sp.]RWB84613.1 MAG: hypothetical protein EOQ52_23810 [Mesorhizobium sp.]
MRFIPSAMSWRQRLAGLAGRVFVNTVAAVVAGVAILFLLLSPHYQGSASTPDTTIGTAQ